MNCLERSAPENGTTCARKTGRQESKEPKTGMREIKVLYKKYEEINIYIIVGVLTTIVSWCACLVSKFFLDSNNDFENFLINTIGWIVGVLFAYPLNRKWVFKSTNKNIPKEFGGFAASRLSTWILDILIMWLMVNVWPFNASIKAVFGWFHLVPAEDTLDTVNYWIAKICISSVIVTILNYVSSKLLIFGKKKN